MNETDTCLKEFNLKELPEGPVIPQHFTHNASLSFSVPRNLDNVRDKRDTANCETKRTLGRKDCDRTIQVICTGFVNQLYVN